MLLRVVSLHARKAALEFARPASCASAIVRDGFVHRGVSTDLIHAEPKAPVQHFGFDLVRPSAAAHTYLLSALPY